MAKLFAVVHIDSLLQEMLLGGELINVEVRDTSEFNSNPVLGEVADNSSPMTPPLINNYRPNHIQIGDQQPSSTLSDQPMSPLSSHMSPLSPASHHTSHLSPVSQHGPLSPPNNQESMDTGSMLSAQYDQMGNNNDPYQHQYRRSTTVLTNNTNREIYQSPPQYRSDNMMLSPSSMIHSPQSNDGTQHQVNDYSVDGMQKRLQSDGHRTEFKLASSEFQASNSSRVNPKQEPEGNFWVQFFFNENVSRQLEFDRLRKLCLSIEISFLFRYASLTEWTNGMNEWLCICVTIYRWCGMV